MDEGFKEKLSLYVSILLFAFFTIYWFYLKFNSTATDSDLDIFAATYGLVALWGGVWGLYISKSWGGFKSVLGRSIIFFSIGLLLQEFGQVAYSYYSMYLQIDIPYPSIGDIGFFGSIPCYIYATYLLAKATGIHISLSSYESKLSAIFLPLTVLSLSYIIFLSDYNFAENDLIRTLLDFGYPLGQSIYLSLGLLTYLLSFKKLGGIMKGAILKVLFALSLQYVADYVFLYHYSRGLFLIAGLSDYLYLVAYAGMTIALINLSFVANNIKQIGLAKAGTK